MGMVTLIYTTGDRVCEATYRQSVVEQYITELGNRLLGAVYDWKPGQRVDARF